MEIPTAALKEIHRKFGLRMTEIDVDDTALTTEKGQIIKIFHHDSTVLDVWDIADEFLMQNSLG